ncbi:TetR/AcrR family transcriptional regulator [Algimonas porphyrae]|uniref:HTH tetR-type domain-containing protein n=1 Tax=Algimonas porphyrae TaxID=1128113 RepID=A0ABQ5V326_9PROT|nr:TetR/AcrR family transcriptional regulator [Algimonas porphyrae]GLQ21377.1 hypothetical protein GCM10007854_23320 [Algimonas porphyrae]
MTSTKPAKRTRLSPQKRRSMILDHAAEVVAEEGVSAATMDRIARQANVSKSLLYAYFDNVTELLRELLQRELRRLRRLQAEAAGSTTDFAEMVRAVTHEYVEYISERGLILQRLQSEPSLAEGRDPTDYGRRDAVRFVAKVVASNFDMPMDLAVACTDISFGIPAAAGHFMEASDNDPKWVEDITVEMIIGSIMGVTEAYRSGRL